MLPSTYICRRQSHSLQDHDHCDEASLGDSGRTDGGRRGRDADGDQVADAQVDASHLFDKMRISVETTSVSGSTFLSLIRLFLLGHL